MNDDKHLWALIVLALLFLAVTLVFAKSTNDSGIPHLLPPMQPWLHSAYQGDFNG